MKNIRIQPNKLTNYAEHVNASTQHEIKLI